MSLGVRVKHLDGLRGLAILLVVTYHAFYRWNDIEPFSQPEIIRVLFKYGWLGVQLFFSISGFVIFMSLDNNASLNEFIKKRWVRLFPLMLLCSIFILIYSSFFNAFPHGKHVDFVDVIPGLIFVDPQTINFFFDANAKSLDGAFWSIYVEVKFYIFVSFFYYFINDKKLISIFSIYIIYLCSKVIDVFFFPDFFLYKALTYWGVNYYGWFLVGICLFQYKKYNDKRFVTAAVFIGLIGCLQLFGNSLEVFFLAMLLLSVFIISFFNEYVQRFFSQKTMIFMGAISYPLYLFHQNFITSFSILLGSDEKSIYGFPNLYPLIFIFVSILISIFLLRIEAALKNFSRYFFMKMKSSFETWC
ncbi:acyltransferase family protein [Aeromonas veronii]|uniref:acyltransferase family protein n=1 Tax=Aeromonas veronii TaxID=654 RepID=UPI003D1B7054